MPTGGERTRLEIRKRPRASEKGLVGGDWRSCGHRARPKEKLGSARLALGAAGGFTGLSSVGATERLAGSLAWGVDKGGRSGGKSSSVYRSGNWYAGRGKRQADEGDLRQHSARRSRVVHDIHAVGVATKRGVACPLQYLVRGGPRASPVGLSGDRREKHLRSGRGVEIAGTLGNMGPRPTRFLRG